MTDINTPALALLAGLITSIHCAGMCGPIACSLTALKSGETRRHTTALLYHGGRLVSYASIGALFGVIGDRFLISFFHSPAAILPWVLVFIFVAIAFGLEKKIPRPTFFKKWVARLRFKALKISATRGALLMGLATPILPCGPLYLLFAACLATGSALRGAEFALAFGLGTIPLLWLTQLGMAKLQLKLGNLWFARIRTTLALGAAIIMAIRLQDTLPLTKSNKVLENSDPKAEQEESLPSCCHE